MKVERRPMMEEGRAEDSCGYWGGGGSKDASDGHGRNEGALTCGRVGVVQISWRSRACRTRLISGAREKNDSFNSTEKSRQINGSDRQVEGGITIPSYRLKRNKNLCKQRQKYKQ